MIPCANPKAQYLSYKDEINFAIQRVLDSGWYILGKEVEKFEEEFANYNSLKHAVGVGSGTEAIYIALRSLGVGAGDEVITTAHTAVATASAIDLAGAKPVFVDIEPEYFTIDPSLIEKALTSNTKAIIPVHIYEQPCDMNTIMEIANKHNLKVIEDCAQAHGANYKSKRIGSIGDIGCFSFYPTKNFTTIEGGMIVTNYKKVADFVRSARNHGISKTLTSRFSGGKPWDYDIKNAGYNYRLDEIRASLGINQIKRIKKMNLLRKKAANYYTKKLGNVNGIAVPDKPIGMEHVHHLYVIRVTRKYPITRDMLFQKLLKSGIRTSVHYKPLHMFSIFKKMAKMSSNFSNSKDIYAQILSLPIYPSISKKQQDLVISNIEKYSD